MIKLIYPDANEELLASCEGSLAKVITSDLKSIKQASSNSITKEMLEECKPDKDHFLIHFIGVGDYEKYGFNKNADAFTKEANQKYYKTFEEGGHLFREHNSSNPEVNAIGQLKKAMYNPEMGRIELAVWGNIKKAAQEYEEALAGKPLSCSMGCSIKFDRDSITGKLCANSSQYEEHMKKHPGQYIPEYKKYAFVYNDTPKFFDLSIVKRPAERIAHYLEYKFASDNTKDWLKTAADNNGCIPSVLLAEMEGIKYSLETKFASQKKSSLLDQLKQKENEFADAIANKSASDSKSVYIKGAAINSFSKDYELSNEELKSIADSKIRPESFFRELAKRASVLSFNSFVNYIYPEKDECKDEAIKLASTCMLPCLFNNLEDTGIDISALEDIFNSGSALDCIADNADADPVQDLMDQVSEKFSLDEDKKEKRIINITIINANNDKNNLDQILPSILKSASEVDTNSLLYNKAKKYAASYAVYKIAAINDIEKFKGEKLNDASLYSLIAQNYIYNF